MSYTDAVTRISQIEAQITAVSGAFTPASAASATQAGATAGTSTAVSSNFASTLAQAQASSGIGQTAVGTGGSTSLPPKAASLLTSSQQQFAARLAADTGLDPGVITAWMLAEESDGAAQSRQAANNNDWLNIGYTDSGTYGAGASVWNDPITAADATAGWLKGQDTIPGYGTASAGVQAVLSTAGQAPAAQIAALQQSGWASSGYPDLPGLYQQVMS
ncbi:MAG TPA: hypothetical protein VMU39_00270 [Solirubrobacteraceae bacterium]|nr:hypothetical protein [Solirubrobacteraceae bacterium]